jgi:YidC/Oxa1 family membrane protein insertase
MILYLKEIGENMDKKTLLAVILSVIVMTGGYLIQNKLAPPVPVIENESTENVTPDIAENVPVIDNTVAVSDLVAVEEDIPSREIKIETNTYDITFNTSGAVISSLIINKYEIMKKYGKFGIKKYDTKMN